MLIDDIKKSLRISNTAYDTEIQDLIDAAKADLILIGVLSEKILDSDPLIKRAITVYCKANFGYNNPDYEKLLQSFNSIKNHLSLSCEYTEV